MALFGDGGDLKTYLAEWWAARLAAAGYRVLYADWEFAGEDLRDRLERLTGPDMPEVWYVRCERPLVAEVDRLARIVRQERIDYAFLDSVAFACDGPPESAEVAGAYFRAVRRLRIGTCSVAHVTKSEGSDQKPFGSTFWHNGFRSTWYVKRSTDGLDPAVATVGLYQRKANLGPRLPAIAYLVTFGEDRTTFAPTSIAEVADLADRLPVAQRIAMLVGSKGALTMAAIAGELEVPVDTIVKTVKRQEGKRFTKVPGMDGVYRIGLLERRSA
jgi:hypothetical protein